MDVPPKYGTGRKEVHTMELTAERLGELLCEHAEYLLDNAVFTAADLPAEVLLTVQALHNLGDALCNRVVTVR